MPDIFAGTNIGKAYGSSDSGKSPGRITVIVDGKKILGRFHFLSTAFSAAADVQMDKTFGDEILVTGFGQKMTTLQLGGVALPDGDTVCDNIKDSARGVKEKTLPELYLRYHAGLLKADGEFALCQVVLSPTIFEGVIVGIQLSPYTLSDGKDMDLQQYTLTIMGTLVNQ